MNRHASRFIPAVGCPAYPNRYRTCGRPALPYSVSRVTTILIGAWAKAYDHDRLTSVLNGDQPFDEQAMVDGHPMPKRDEELVLAPAEKG